MRRFAVTLLLPFLFACSGRPSPAPVSPMGPASPLTGNAPVSASDLPPAPVIDSALLAADFDAERKQAADSAADEAVLEELAAAHPAGDEPDDASSDEQPETVAGGAKALTDAVTWDIDVATYNSHNR